MSKSETIVVNAGKYVCNYCNNSSGCPNPGNVSGEIETITIPPDESRVVEVTIPDGLCGGSIQVDVALVQRGSTTYYPPRPLCAHSFTGTCPCAPPAAPSLDDLAIYDKNKQSVSPVDGSPASALREVQPFYYVGGIFDDPFRNQSAPSSITSGDPTVLFAGIPRSYQYSDHNPMEFNFTFKEDTGASNITEYDFKLVDTSDANYKITLTYNNSSVVGLLDPVAGTTNTYSNFTDCINDSSTVACVKKLSEYVDSSDATLLHVNVRAYLKNSLRNTNYKLTGMIRNAGGGTWTGDVDLTNYGWPNSTLLLDTVAPNVSITSTNALGNRITFNVDVTDANIDNSKVYLFRSYAVALNSEKGNRFLTTLNDIALDGTDFENSPFGSSGYSITPISGGYRYRINVKGLQGGDDVYFGVCAFDKAGNVNCTYTNIAQVGWNWLKTSLGNVYSKGDASGGFTGLPNYSTMSSTSEDPIASDVSPYNASRAVISNFVISSVSSSLAGVQWGYDGHYNSPEFVRSDQPVGLFSWFSLLEDTATAKCNIDSSCTISTLSGSSASNLSSALSSTASARKVIKVENATVSFDSLTCRRANLVFLKNTQLTVKEILKPGSDPLKNVYDGCVFVADNSSSVTIEDDPNSSWDSHDNVDLVQAGFVMLGNATFRVKQTPHNAYEDSNGQFDRLIIHGFVHTQNRVPIFERDLSITDNQQYPSEWIVFDSSLVPLLKPVLGAPKVDTIHCGLVDHPFCHP